MKQNQKSYDFPVELQPTFTKGGLEIPRARAVVRLDTMEPIANVSARYKLYPHKQMEAHAMTFISAFGTPEVRHFVDRHGAVMTGEYTFRERGVEIQKGDMVGLRIYTRSNYMGTAKNHVQIGGLRLWCLNGAVHSETVFEMGFRHTAKAVDNFVFPEPTQILDAFKSAGQSWKRLAKYVFGTEKEYRLAGEKLVDEGVAPAKALAVVVPNEDTEHKDLTAWKLYNRFTYYINHGEKAGASYSGKLRRLGAVDRAFNELVVA